MRRGEHPGEYGNKRQEHPQCHGCRNAMEWGIVRVGLKREAHHGICLNGYGDWPEGCRHFVERLK